MGRKRKMATKKKQLSMLFGTAALLFLCNTTNAFVHNGNEWPGSHPRIPYYVSTSLQGNVPYDGTYEQGIEAIQNAANTWNTQGDSEFQFFYAGETEVAEVANDGINAVIFSEEECPYGQFCRAVTIYHETNEIFEGFDIVLYNKKGTSGSQIYWSTITMNGWESDVESVLLHELGHALGLGHSQYPDVVMGTTCTSGCIQRNLAWDDEEGIQDLYFPYSNEGFWSTTNQVLPGQSFSLHLDYPEAAGKDYAIMMSLEEGMYPLYNEDPADSRILQISDNYFPAENYPETFQNFEGTLDSNGQVTALVNAPSNAGIGTGATLYFTVVTFDCSYLNCYEDVGVRVEVDITSPPSCYHTGGPAFVNACRYNIGISQQAIY